MSKIDLFRVSPDAGYSRPQRMMTLDISAEDKPGFTPFLKTTPDGKEVWFSHKLADRVSARACTEPFALLDAMALGDLARPKHVEFVENRRGSVVYASLARVDDNGRGAVAASKIDRSAAPGSRKVVGTFFSRAREAHGIWSNPVNDLLYIAHEQDELPVTPNPGRPAARRSTFPIPSHQHSSRKFRLVRLSSHPASCATRRASTSCDVRPGYRGQTA